MAIVAPPVVRQLGIRGICSRDEDEQDSAVTK